VNDSQIGLVAQTNALVSQEVIWFSLVAASWHYDVLLYVIRILAEGYIICLAVYVDFTLSFIY